MLNMNSIGLRDKLLRYQLIFNELKCIFFKFDGYFRRSRRRNCVCTFITSKRFETNIFAENISEQVRFGEKIGDLCKVGACFK